MASRKDPSVDLAARRPLERAVFDEEDEAFELSARRSLEDDIRRSSQRSAASMLSFYLYKAGSNLPEDRRRTLEKAKDELLQGLQRN